MSVGIGRIRLVVIAVGRRVAGRRRHVDRRDGGRHGHVAERHVLGGIRIGQTKGDRRWPGRDDERGLRRPVDEVAGRAVPVQPAVGVAGAGGDVDRAEQTVGFALQGGDGVVAVQQVDFGVDPLCSEHPGESFRAAFGGGVGLESEITSARWGASAANVSCHDRSEGIARRPAPWRRGRRPAWCAGGRTTTGRWVRSAAPVGRHGVVRRGGCHRTRPTTMAPGRTSPSRAAGRRGGRRAARARRRRRRRGPRSRHRNPNGCCGRGAPARRRRASTEDPVTTRSRGRRRPCQPAKAP